MSDTPADHPLYQGILDVAAAVQAAERDADSGIITTAELLITTLRTQRDFGLAPSLAEPAVLKVRRALDANLDGRNAIIEAHLEYGKIARSMGATAESWGPTWPCTDARAGGRRKRALQAVA